MINESWKTTLFTPFYSNDVQIKKEGMHQYVYWYNPHINTIKENEIIKPIHSIKYVINNIPTLEEWCGLKYSQVLYDSDIDGTDSVTFRERIMNHEHVYFIIIDDHDNVFGHYHPGIINKVDESLQDVGIFVFTLNNDGRCGVKKYGRTYGIIYTYINSDKFFTLGNEYTLNFYYSIGEIGSGNSYMYMNDIEDAVEGIHPNDLLGQNTNCFITKRLIVVKMN